MNLQDLGNLGEFIGAIATVATLIYLAIQIRQNTASVQTQAELSLSERMSEWAKEIINNPRMGMLWNQAAREPDSLNEEERMLFIWFVFQLFLIVEGHFQLYIKRGEFQNVPSGRRLKRRWD